MQGADENARPKRILDTRGFVFSFATQQSDLFQHSPAGCSKRFEGKARMEAQDRSVFLIREGLCFHSQRSNQAFFNSQLFFTDGGDGHGLIVKIARAALHE